MDRRSRWFAPMEGASDGWGCRIPLQSWTVYDHFSVYEDVVPCRKYKVFIRVKTTEPQQEGDAVVAGLNRGNRQGSDKMPDRLGSIFKGSVPAATLADGAFHAVEIGEFVCDPGSGWYNGNFWVATPGKGSPEVLLDCIWLREVKGNEPANK